MEKFLSNVLFMFSRWLGRPYFLLQVILSSPHDPKFLCFLFINIYDKAFTPYEETISDIRWTLP